MAVKAKTIVKGLPKHLYYLVNQKGEYTHLSGQGFVKNPAYAWTGFYDQIRPFWGKYYKGENLEIIKRKVKIFPNGALNRSWE